MAKTGEGENLPDKILRDIKRYFNNVESHAFAAMQTYGKFVMQFISVRLELVLPRERTSSNQY